MENREGFDAPLAAHPLAGWYSGPGHLLAASVGPPIALDVRPPRSIASGRSGAARVLAVTRCNATEGLLRDYSGESVAVVSVTADNETVAAGRS